MIDLEISIFDLSNVNGKIIDIRNLSDYKNEHIDGAINIMNVKLNLIPCIVACELRFKKNIYIYLL